MAVACAGQMCTNAIWLQGLLLPAARGWHRVRSSNVVAFLLVFCNV